MANEKATLCDSCDRQKLELGGELFGAKRWLRSCKYIACAATGYLLELEAHRTGRCPFYKEREPPQPDSYIAADSYPVITFKDLLSP